MTGMLLIVVGLSCGMAGWLLLRRHGTGWRVGRLLAAAPMRSLAGARDLAVSGEVAYVRVHGRVESAEEFPDENGNPLVYRRRRLQRGRGRAGGGPGWQTFDDERLAVPFGLGERGERVAIDVEALGDGLVVVPREAIGVADDVAAVDASASKPIPDMPPDTPVRLLVEQVSAVEHATAAGVPRLDAAEQVVLGPGMGRPLILTTLEVDEAMRVLAAGRRSTLLLATGLLAAAPIIVLAGLATAFLVP